MSEDLERREIAAEQEYVDRVYVQLEASARSAQQLAAEGQVGVHQAGQPGEPVPPPQGRVVAEVAALAHQPEQSEEVGRADAGGF